MKSDEHQLKVMDNVVGKVFVINVPLALKRPTIAALKAFGKSIEDVDVAVDASYTSLWSLWPTSTIRIQVAIEGSSENVAIATERLDELITDLSKLTA